jgi:hypothetical protein
MPDPARPVRSLLPKDCDIRDPISFFELFFREEQYELLARNTNKYAAAYSELYPNQKPKFWKETDLKEIKVYVALLIYIGINKNNNPY